MSAGRPIKTTKYDEVMTEQFQIGKNPNEVFHLINFQELMKQEKPIVSRSMVYRRYSQWVKRGKPGELYISEQYKDLDGDLITVWKLKQQ